MTPGTEMPDHFLITDVDKTRRLITFRLSGMEPSRYYVDLMLDAYKQVPELWLYNRILDHRKFRGFIEFDDLLRIQAFWAEVMEGRNEKPRVALVTRDPLAHARTSAAGNMFTDAQFRSFMNMRQALAWIRETEKVTA